VCLGGGWVCGDFGFGGAKQTMMGGERNGEASCKEDENNQGFGPPAVLKKTVRASPEEAH